LKASAVVASLVVSPATTALAARHVVSPSESFKTPQLLTRLLQMALVMMLGFKASLCPLATVGSTGRKVPSVALRPGRPSWKSMAGLQFPNRAALAARAGILVATAVAAVKSARRSVLVCILKLVVGKVKVVGLAGGY